MWMWVCSRYIRFKCLRPLAYTEDFTRVKSTGYLNCFRVINRNSLKTMTFNPLGMVSCLVAYRQRYPPLEPFNEGTLQVSDLHQLHYEECGAETGIPVVYLHGGPGGNVEPKDRQLFDPAVYRCILFDQRGCGKSKPVGELCENDTWHLVADIERLRNHLNIDRWVVYGGSWGSLLALVYAIKHPESVRGMLIWGIAYCTNEDNDWLMGPRGAAFLLPDYYEEFESIIPVDERNDIIGAYRKRINSSDREEAARFSAAWGLWEYRACKIQIPDDGPKNDDLKNNKSDDNAKGDGTSSNNDSEEQAIAMAKLETHYFANEAFIVEKGKNFIFDNVDALKSRFPVIVFQGRLDLVCPAAGAWKLKKLWPETDLRFVADGVHSSSTPSMLTAIMNGLDELKNKV